MLRKCQEMTEQVASIFWRDEKCLKNKAFLVRKANQARLRPWFPDSSGARSSSAPWWQDGVRLALWSPGASPRLNTSSRHLTWGPSPGERESDSKFSPSM